MMDDFHRCNRCRCGSCGVCSSRSGPEHASSSSSGNTFTIHHRVRDRRKQQRRLQPFQSLLLRLQIIIIIVAVFILQLSSLSSHTNHYSTNCHNGRTVVSPPPLLPRAVVAVALPAFVLHPSHHHHHHHHHPRRRPRWRNRIGTVGVVQNTPVTLVVNNVVNCRGGNHPTTTANSSSNTNSSSGNNNPVTRVPHQNSNHPENFPLADDAADADADANINIDDDDYAVRFRGIGRLYARTTSTPSTFNSTIHDDVPDDSGDDDNNESSTLKIMSDRTKHDDNNNNTTTVLQRLQQAVVVVVGVGGVGSWTVEALGRSGIGTIILIDLDDICISNVNRQLPALSSTVGAMKIDVCYQRLLQINPKIVVHRVYDFVSTDNVYEIFDTINTDWGVAAIPPNSSNDDDDDDDDDDDPYHATAGTKRVTAVLDCMDGAREKAALLAYCQNRSIPICTVGSTAGRTNPARVTFGDITHVHTSAMGHSRDRLLCSVRKELRQQYNFTPGRPFGRKSKPWFIPCVYSEEEVMVPSPLVTITNTDSNDAISTTAAATTASFRQCDNGVLGTASFVTGTFGFVAASIIVQGIAQNELRPPQGTPASKRE